jgi:uncharacterized protein (TIGR00251 family)
MSPWCSVDAEGAVSIWLHVQPGAKKNEIVGLYGEALKLRLAAAPVDGKANAALIEYIAATLDVPRSNVEVLAGAASRRKRLRIRGVPLDALDALRARVQRV